ncbi:MAG: response regulator [Ignavibacteriae bacterium]|nr:MAG: response regulator [Ignavibacteriota bacterium]
MTALSLRALVVDDDHPYSVLLKKALTERGHSVVICSSAEEVFRCLEKEQIDIMLLDYKMEGISGINVLQWMYGKKMEIPVILITGYGSEEIYEEAFKWGAAEYFMKGELDAVRLPVMVEQVYNKHLARRTKFKK